MSNNIYYFTASWCGPCKAISPSIDLLNNKYENIKFYKIDVDDEENNEICNSFDISSIPCFLFFKDGKLVNRFVGADIKNLEKLIIEIFIN